MRTSSGHETDGSRIRGPICASWGIAETELEDTGRKGERS